MQVTVGDATNRFSTLDLPYFYSPAQLLSQVAWIKHKAKSSTEIDLEVGDEILNGWVVNSKEGLVETITIFSDIEAPKIEALRNTEAPTLHV